MLKNINRLNKNFSRDLYNRSSIIRRQGIKSYSSHSTPNESTINSKLIFATGAILTGFGLIYFNNYQGSANQAIAKVEEKLPVDSASRDYQKVYNAIVDVLETEDYDDGSFAPVLLRLGE